MMHSVQGGWAATCGGGICAEATRAPWGILCTVFTLFALNLIAVPAVAQNDADVELLTERAESFLTGLGKDAPGAFNVLLANSNLADTDEINRMVTAAKDLPGKYGAFLKAERIEAKRVGQDLVLMTFLYKAERFPIVWRFAFYRPRENWVVVAIRFDSRLLDLKLPAVPTSP